MSLLVLHRIVGRYLGRRTSAEYHADRDSPSRPPAGLKKRFVIPAKAWELVWRRETRWMSTSGSTIPAFLKSSWTSPRSSCSPMWSTSLVCPTPALLGLESRDEEA